MRKLAITKTSMALKVGSASRGLGSSDRADIATRNRNNCGERPYPAPRTESYRADRQLVRGGVMRRLVVRDVMTSTVVAVRVSTPFKEIARVLTERRVSALPVLDADDRLVGVVSEADLLPKEE